MGKNKKSYKGWFSKFSDGCSVFVLTLTCVVEILFFLEYFVFPDSEILHDFHGLSDSYFKYFNWASYLIDILNPLTWYEMLKDVICRIFGFDLYSKTSFKISITLFLLSLSYVWILNVIEAANDASNTCKKNNEQHFPASEKDDKQGQSSNKVMKTKANKPFIGLVIKLQFLAALISLVLLLLNGFLGNLIFSFSLINKSIIFFWLLFGMSCLMTCVICRIHGFKKNIISILAALILPVATNYIIFSFF
jgi:hypothetical protein